MPDVHAPRVTIVVTQRESFVHTQRSLESLYATTELPFRLVYVDGGSPPLTRAFLKKQASARGFELVRRNTFLSPNAARNIGFAFVRSELVVFAENDVLFTDGWLEALVAGLDEARAAVVGPLIYFREPAFSIVHSAGGALRFDPTPSGNFYQHIQRFKEIPIDRIAQRLERTTVDFVEFHCLLARTDVVRTCGPFDEALTTCCEFEDFCLTVKRAGAVVVNEPASVVQHMLPLPPPRGLADARFLMTRWNRQGNAASTRHFRAKWNVRDDDPFMRGVAAWCDGRPLSIVTSTRTFKALRSFKRGIHALVPRRG